jgi:nanoRNase/pAp phosphatase (c-di-AMP/oligoRNAs hydrolase)
VTSENSSDTSAPKAKPANGSRNGASDPQRRSEAFLRGLRSYSGVILISHVHPDPDSIGSMLALAYLINNRVHLPTIITQDGFIGRAENQAMVEHLNIELRPLEKVTWEPSYAVVMVDSQPNTGRHRIPPEVPVYAVIDHHDTGGDLENVPFVDVRSDFGATCTMVTTYLIEQQVEIPARVATALLYGIESELIGYPREAGPLDDHAILYLYEHADKDLLAQIRHARLPHSYFETLVQALQCAFTYDRLIMSWAGDLPQAELAAEIADLLIRLNEVDWSFCAGIYQDNMIISVRTSLPNAQAGQLLQQVVNGYGRAGGHDRRAGGSIPLDGASSKDVELIRSNLRKKLLQVLDIDECRGQRLVSRKEQLQNLQS